MTEFGVSAIGLVTAFAGGAGFGVVYFTLLWRWTKAVVQGEFGAGRLALAYAFRLALAVGALALALAAGADAGDMLAAVLGFTIARQAILRRKPQGG